MDQSTYHNLEEFFAILVESEMRLIGLRGGHGGESLPPKQRDDARVFLGTGKNRARCERFRSEMTQLFGVLRHVPTRWNPLAALGDAGAKQ